MTGFSADGFSTRLVERLTLECAQERGQRRIAAFNKYSRQVEGWFKGELLTIALEMEETGEIAKFTPDCRIDPLRGKQNIDLHFALDKKRQVWIELKHWYIGRYPSGTQWNATSYFTQNTSATVNRFLEKLPIGWDQPTYMLIAATPKPQSSDWKHGLQQLVNRHPDRRFKVLTMSDSFPDSYYLGLLRIGRNEKVGI